MKKNTLALALAFVFAALTIFSTATTASANNGTTATFNVSFDFYIGDKKVPAGKYSIQRVSTDVFMIFCDENKVSVLVRASQAYNYDNNESTRLIFNTYGDERFLSEIHTAAAAGGRVLPQSKTERGAQKELQTAKAKSVKTVVTTTE